ncbi:hypothetical protein Moror_14685 [Moniliophthora roreri MCA 2997]|uniref:Uncharacterized protein n=2 Tax=Moniliophthora roreri TaxID=221103 RepID=V2Y9U3_MONRO|nr:hypothetical protein Moror_14685 [Moniliophthora roreri MCA 2997]
MRALNGFYLDDDIINRILCSSDFGTLYAAILTAKSFYRVFQTHPNSILRAVAHNVSGPAISQALRYIRFVDEARRTQDLEDFFSFTHKNRKSKTSQLTYLESWRFKRALYRIMLYSHIFPGSRWLSEDGRQEDANDDEDESED